MIYLPILVFLIFFAISFSIVFCLMRSQFLLTILMDVPNARSSHTVVRPRGGGLAISISFLMALIVVGVYFKFSSMDFLLAAVGSGFVIGLLGFWDDVRHIPARIRFFVQVLCSVWVLYFIGGLPNLALSSGIVIDGWVGYVVGVVGVVWLINLYNFMDGIDGIASLEAICVCVSGCFFYFLLDQSEHIWKPLLLIAAVSGFAIWNFPVAKIFMGDCGSAFLGLMMAILTIDAGRVHPDLFWAWLIVLGVFVVDASFTLMRRLLQHERFYEAHRSHGYQIAARKLKSHVVVTLLVVLINFLWLLPLAVCVVMDYVDSLVGIFFAYVPLVFLAWYLGAGSKNVGRASYG